MKRRVYVFSAKKAKKRYFLCAALLLLLPAALVMRAFFAAHPEITERAYSRSFYPVISGIISRYFYLFPFSYAEFFLYSLVIFGLFMLIFIIVCAVRRRFASALRAAAFIACACTAGYFLFNVMWGFNYCRLPLEASLGYKAGIPATSELTAALTREKAAVNSLCASGKINFYNGTSHYHGGFDKISAHVNDGYTALAKDSAESKGLIDSAAPRPKGIVASRLLSYTGIGGIFVPFTYEPNVNVDPGKPDFTLPFDAAHESAHFKGFAREEEANFIAYLADTHSGDPYFQYSAHLNAYLYLSNALYSADYDAWQSAGAGLDSRAVADLKAYSDYIVSHQSKVGELSTKINDNYLKSQGQRGVISYDLFVTLLCDRYRSR